MNRSLFNSGCFLLLPAVALIVGGCTGGSSKTDSNIIGVGGNFTVSKLEWGRMVVVKDINGTSLGKKVIDPTIETDGTDYIVTTNAVTEITDVEIQHVQGTDAFDAAFLALDTNTDGTSKLTRPTVKGPLDTFGFQPIPQNAAIKLTFSVPVDFSTVGINTVKVQFGAPPNLPYQVVYYQDGTDERVVIIKATVTGFENATFGLPINATGFPESATTSVNNLDFVFPTKTNELIGQNVTVRSQEGSSLVALTNPVMVASPNTPTSAAIGDIVLKYRSGNSADTNGGFLQDDVRPTILGVQSVTVSSVTSLGGDSVRVQFTFSDTFCQALPPQVGDVMLQGQNFGVVAAVVQATSPQIVDIDVVSGSLSAGTTATYKTAFDELQHLTPTDLSPCFVTISPPSGNNPPTSNIDPTSTFTIEFSEPVKTATVLPFRTLAITNRINPETDGTTFNGAIIAELDKAPDASHPEWPRMTNFVVGSILVSEDHKRFTFTPLQSLNNDPLTSACANGTECDKYDFHAVLGSTTPLKEGIQDLGGNFLDLTSNFRIEGITVGGSNTPTQSVTLRFKSASLDEDAVPTGAESNVLAGTGQGVFVTGLGGIRGRSAVPYSRLVDDSQTFVSLMNVTQGALQTPLVPLGARMMTTYRYHDVFGGQVPAGQGGATGPSLIDKEGWNVQVIGMNWSPFGGALFPDNFGRFVIKMGHSMYSPIANIDGLLTTCPWQYTGFNDSVNRKQFNQQAFELTSFAVAGGNAGMNIASKYKTVFDSQYKILSSNVFTMGGHVFTPFEFVDTAGVHHGFSEEFTWRDTTNVETSGTNLGLPFLAGGIVTVDAGNGCPAFAPIATGEGADSSEYTKAQLTQNLTYKFNPASAATGTAAPTRSLPSIALPLLVEFKCYNNFQQQIQAQGINGFATSFMFNTNQTGQQNPPAQMDILPASRCFSQGYRNLQSGQVFPIDPDNAVIPSGGYCPINCPPNGNSPPTTTAGFDPTIYWSVIDMQNTRSIFMTRWFDTGLANPTYGGAVVEPATADLPVGTQIQVHYRGATTVSGNPLQDARRLDPFGNCNGVNPAQNTSTPYSACTPTAQPSGLTDWTTDITTLNGKKFVQARITLIANDVAQFVPEMKGIGISYR